MQVRALRVSWAGTKFNFFFEILDLLIAHRPVRYGYTYMVRYGPVPEGAPRRPRGGPLVPARNWASSPASVVPVGKPGLKALTGRD
jgi:hypothetical protein